MPATCPSSPRAGRPPDRVAWAAGMEIPAGEPPVPLPTTGAVRRRAEEAPLDEAQDRGVVVELVIDEPGARVRRDHPPFPSTTEALPGQMLAAAPITAPRRNSRRFMGPPSPRHGALAAGSREGSPIPSLRCKR